MTGGTINIVNNDSRIKYGGIRIEDNGIVTISGDARITGRDWHRLYIESGKLYADGGTIELGMTIRSNGTVDSTHSGTGTVIRGSVENNGTISAGQYTGEVSNCILISEDNEILGEGTINGGSFAGKVSNTSLIKDGTFNSEVDNQGTISGGTFLGTVETENGTIEDSAKVSVNFVNEAGETIKTVRVLRGQRITLADLPEIDPTPYGYRKVKYSVGNTEYREEDKFIDEVRFTEDETVVTVTLIHPITYKITYDLNGGSIQHLEREYQVTSDDITLGTPTKDGYAFIGWGGTGLDGENNMTVTIPKGSTGDREYTAYYWKNLGGDLMSPDYSYTVVYDTQGGSPVEPKTVPKLLASATKVLDGADTTRAGYMFAGWYCGNKRIALQDTTVKDLADRADNGVITITAHWREKLEVSFNTAAQECTYDGTAKAFEIKDTTLDGFQVTYRKNGNTVTAPINAGSYDVIVTREEDRKYKAVNVTIPGGLVIQPKTVEATISTIPDQTYTGKEIKPAITVSDGIDEMPASEYTVDYADNRNAGTATVTVTAKEGGNYTFPQITRNFTIKQKSINPAVTMADYVYGTDPDYPELSGNDGGGTVSVYYSTSDDIADNTAHRLLWDVDSIDGTTLNVGTYYMMAEVAETRNYTSGISPVSTFRVIANQYDAPTEATLNGSSVTVSEADRDKELEYSLNGGDWIDVPGLNNGSFVPAGLAENTGFTLSIRVKASADGNYEASETVGYFFVAYNANGGTGTVPSGASASSGNSVTVASGDRLGRDGYTFGGWNTEADGTGTAYTPGSSVTTGATLYAQWTANRYTVTFDTVGGTEIASKTTVQWTDAVLDGVSEPTRDGWKFTGWKCGDMTVNANTMYSDLAANDTVTSVTLVAQWKDIQKPVITGLENGNIYCDAVEFEVCDNDGITSVKANDVELTATDGKYTLAKGVGTVTVVAKDNAGNETSATVTVNNGHTAGNDDGNCSTPVYCIYHPDTVVVAAKSHDFSGEWQKNGTDHWHICQNDGCTVAETETPHSCTDDGDCTTAVVCECGYVITAANAKHTYGEWQSNSDDTHTRYCTVEGCNGYEDGNCAGGEATCTSKAVCDTCGEEYGELDSSNHTGSKEWETTETQHKQYWSCCDAVVVDYEDHTWNNGVCSVCGYPCSHDYDSVVTPPTCTESGYTTHTCANCGNSYVDSEVPATGHSFKFFKCVNCGMHYGCKGANCVFCSIVRWLDGLINSCEIWLTEAPVSIGKWFAGIFNCIVSAIK